MSEQLELLSPHELMLVDAIAERVLEVLEQRIPSAPARLVSAAELAPLLGVSRSTVYDHAAELGAIEVGGGGKPRLRFDVEVARKAWTRRVPSEKSERAEAPAPAEQRRRRPRQRLGGGPELLPVKGPEQPADFATRAPIRRDADAPVA